MTTPKKPTVEANAGLVHRVARRYRSACTKALDYNDLLQAGLIGLMRACDVFDPTRGYQFSTCAFWWIRQAIIREIHNNGRTVRLPSHIHESYLKRKATLPQDAFSIDSPKHVWSEIAPLDTMAADTDTAEETRRRELSDAAGALTSQLSKRQREIIRLRFVEELTLAEVGERMGGFSREWARQAESEALALMRRAARRDQVIAREEL